MSAIGLLIRIAWRRHWRASLLLALAAALVATVVAASLQAAALADTSLARFKQRSRIYDEVVQGCPPEVDPEQIGDTADFLRLCGNPPTAERFRTVLSKVEGVEATAVGSILVVALLDESTSNHWGRLTLLEGSNTPGSPVPEGLPIILEGRLVDPAAPDEVVVSEDAARVAGLHVGDSVRMAGWHQDDLDRAVDGSVPPQTTPFASTVVGVVRYLDDVQPSGAGTLSDSTIPGDFNVYAGPAWMAAHGGDFSGYGSAVFVRLRDGSESVEDFVAELNTAPDGWLNNPSSVTENWGPSIERIVDLERRAVLVFAAIAALAGMVFVVLTAMRQLRRESADAMHLMALGMTRRDLRTFTAIRGLTIALPAAVLATLGLLAVSPLEPVGLARKLEFDHEVQLDAIVATATVAGVLLVLALAGFATSAGASAPPAAARRGVFVRLAMTLRGLGPVAATGATIRSGRSARAAVAASAVAVAACIAAAGLVASYDRVTAEPRRFGAWWDVAVGQYSQQGPLEAGVAKLRANPVVVAAAGYNDQFDIARIDGRSVPFLTAVNYVGHREPVMADGRGPTADDEVALARDTARALGKGIGDDVSVVASNDIELQLRVVGIILYNDPIGGSGGAGEGAFVPPQVMARIAGPGSVPQSIVIQLDPTADRAAALESVRQDFPGSIREATPQVDLRNLGRLRVVPWLIAGLIGILALATLVHALVTKFALHRMTLAVLAALGFTRRQRRWVCVSASVALALTGIVVGVPVGFVAGQRVWRVIIDGVALTSGSAPAWVVAVVAAAGALVLATGVALVASWGLVRATPTERLRVE